MARPSNTEKRKAQIVEALLDVVATQGFERASIKLIAEAADLTPGLIHYHFNTKQDVLLALIDDLERFAAERFESLAPPEASPLARLDGFIDSLLEIGSAAERKRAKAWVVVGTQAMIQPRVQARYQQVIGNLVEELTLLMTEALGGRATVIPIRDLAAILIAAIEGAFQLSATAPDIMPKNYAAQSVKALIASMLRSAS